MVRRNKNEKTKQKEEIVKNLPLENTFSEEGKVRFL